MNVFDSALLLRYLQGGDASNAIESVLEEGGVCSAASWSEVAQQVHSRGRDWALARALLLGFGLVIEPATAVDAERAALKWRADRILSLADRLCLALGDRLDSPVLTVDPSSGRVRQIR